jgi:hypothetical protein
MRIATHHEWIDTAHFDVEYIATFGSDRYMSNINASEVMGEHGDAVMNYIRETVGGAGGMKDHATLLAESAPYSWSDICEYYLSEAVFLLAEEMMEGE